MRCRTKGVQVLRKDGGNFGLDHLSSHCMMLRTTVGCEKLTTNRAEDFGHEISGPEAAITMRFFTIDCPCYAPSGRQSACRRSSNCGTSQRVGLVEGTGCSSEHRLSSRRWVRASGPNSPLQKIRSCWLRWISRTRGEPLGESLIG